MATSSMLLHSPVQWQRQMSNRNGVSRNGTGCYISLLGKKSNSVALRGPYLGTVRKTRLAASPSDEKQKISGSENLEVVNESMKESKQVLEEEKGGFVKRIEEEMGRQFGKTLWFAVLIVCLAVFGGGYVYYIVNFANFDDIPILRGPVGR
ncbi:hypothetical protein R1flu_020978 [Riccia fluitans]|uniref:Uncharacterized protein n=1 Tax=Riccia fluitans TaxID=41844 RepID=A0ABD1ZPJ4_9MARC